MSELLNRIKSLLDRATTLGGTIGFDCEQELRDASNCMLEQQLAQEQWIPVSERLPDFTTPVEVKPITKWTTWGW